MSASKTALLVHLFLMACSSPSPGAEPSDAGSAHDAGPSCAEQARTCLDTAVNKADILTCRAAWVSCKERDGGGSP